MTRRPKRWVAMGSAVGLLLGGALLYAQELQNPSFEQPMESGLWGSDRAANWERLGGWFNRETTWSPVFDGECMLAYHHWQIKQSEPSVVYQDIANVPTGKLYTFSIKTFKDKFTNAEFVELRLEPFLGGAPLARNTYGMSNLKGGKWNELSVTGMPVTAGVRVLVSVKPGHSSERKGALKFDQAGFTVRNQFPGAWRASSYGITRRQ